MVRRACSAVASCLGFGTLCGFLGAKCFIFSASIPVQVRTNTQTYRETYRDQSLAALSARQPPSSSLFVCFLLLPWVEGCKAPGEHTWRTDQRPSASSVFSCKNHYRGITILSHFYNLLPRLYRLWTAWMYSPDGYWKDAFSILHSVCLHAKQVACTQRVAEIRLISSCITTRKPHYESPLSWGSSTGLGTPGFPVLPSTRETIRNSHYPLSACSGALAHAPSLLCRHPRPSHSTISLLSTPLPSSVRGGPELHCCSSGPPQILLTPSTPFPGLCLPPSPSVLLPKPFPS
jgi:hypothetical protein